MNKEGYLLEKQQKEKTLLLERRKRKIKKMFEQNQRDMEFAPFEEQMKLIQLHKQLKEFEIAITKQLGTVILR